MDVRPRYDESQIGRISCDLEARAGLHLANYFGSSGDPIEAAGFRPTTLESPGTNFEAAVCRPTPLTSVFSIMAAKATMPSAA